MNSKQIVQVLSALAQETRLEVFRLLVRAGTAGLSAGTISEKLDLPAATLSFHLKELRSAGVIDCERQSRSLIYRPRFETMATLINHLSAECCSGVDQ